MKKNLILLVILVLSTTLIHAFWVRVYCYGSVQAMARVEVQDGNYNIIGASSQNPYWDVIGSNPNNPTALDFEVNSSLATSWVRIKGYGPLSFDHNCNISDWVTGSWPGDGTQMSPYTFSETMYLDLEPYDVKIATYSNIKRLSTISLMYEGTNTPNGYPNTEPIYEVENVQLSKGWSVFNWDDLNSPSFDGPSSWLIYITESGVGGEEYSFDSGILHFSSANGYWYNYPNPKFCFENKPLHNDWNWESFPELTINSTTNNGMMNFVPSLINNIDPGNYNWLTLLGQSLNLTYEYGVWSQTSYPLNSTAGVKIKLEDGNYIADGTRVLENTEIELEEGWNWIGYWLPHSQMCDDAFGDDWDKVNVIRAEDWYYDDLSINRGIGEPEPVSSQPKPFHYGEAYMVKMHESMTLCLQPSEGESENFDKPESQYFEYEVKADYEVIDIVEVPENVTEIGVFEDDTCVGAVVVQEPSVQILVYSENANREQIPFSFEVITGRGNSTPIRNYEVYNFNSGCFESGIIASQMQNYSLVKLGEQGQHNNTPSMESIKLHGNYPNPFNPTTEIAFSLSSDQHIDLIIYNTKGQIVRSLTKGNFTTGEHSVTWDGTDNEGKNVSSGLYFYKLKTDNKEISKKMLLLK